MSSQQPHKSLTAYCWNQGQNMIHARPLVGISQISADLLAPSLSLSPSFFSFHSFPPSFPLAIPCWQKQLSCHVESRVCILPSAFLSLTGLLLPLCSLEFGRASPAAQIVQNLPAMQDTWVQFLGEEGPLEKRMNGYPLQYSCLEIPWTEEPGRYSHGVADSDTTEWLEPSFLLSQPLHCSPLGWCATESKSPHKSECMSSLS